ncbi:Zn-ribbon domain-containing OB-fold protein [Nocardioides sp. L-11A]|uniref:Zn-ribbon domain-containing OB-fold protein n=1 Tax=Nocardioides sp. L-11A TaxID=3043848 RepID=UPI00249B8244|nr:OB-fold domain-containing protein [Nocardioides sp. L-11A]
MKPVPLPTPDTQEWFDRIDAGELTVPRCTACASFFLHPRSSCPRCGARAVELIPAAGTGVLLSFVVNHRAPAGFEAPYALGVVALAEGPRLTGIVRTDAPDRLEVDAPVRVAFEERGERRVVCFELKEAGR